MDTGQIAKKYGGGGHPNASGFTYTGNISDLFKIEP
jgi:nanoRNase/pAp phosphatase (c-di-AMP/oligoRNAs hydrolase)